MQYAKNTTALRTQRRRALATTHPAVPPQERDGINPKTGRRWSLADPQVKPELVAELKAMKENQTLAVEFLQDVGILTPSGRLSSKYGGR